MGEGLGQAAYEAFPTLRFCICYWCSFLSLISVFFLGVSYSIMYLGHLKHELSKQFC